MDFTINCTRVPIPAGTLFEGIPVEIGLAPALSGLDSDHVSFRESNDRSSLNHLDGDISIVRMKDQNNSFVAKNEPFLVHLTPVHLPQMAASMS